MIALAVTPARQISGLPWIGRFRRMLGLFAFFYVLLHFLAWLILDQGLAWPAILADVTERPFITIGFGALIILTAMAATSKTTHSGWLVPRMHTEVPGSTPSAISPLAAQRIRDVYSAQLVVAQRSPLRTA